MLLLDTYLLNFRYLQCRLEKRVVKKTNPETSCQKMPREICAPSNCVFQKSEKVHNFYARFRPLKYASIDNRRPFDVTPFS